MLRKIKIDRKIYESLKTKEKINNEFTEFILKKYTIDEFFDLYQQLFYEIEKTGRLSHTTIVAKSTEYAGTPPNPKDQEILDFLPFLQKQIEIIKPKIIYLLGTTAAKAILSTPISLDDLTETSPTSSLHTIDLLIISISPPMD